MPVKNVECQLAEMQIGRFVSGESLSAEAVRQLDAHLTTCDNCTRVLNDRRQALKSMLKQGYAAVTTDFPTAKKENLLIKALVEKATTNTSTPPRRTSVEASPERAAPKSQWNPASALGLAGSDNKAVSLKKALIYSAALGVVLFGMGYMSHGQNSLLGDSAEQAYPSSDNGSQKAQQVSTTGNTSDAASSSTNSVSTPAPDKSKSEAPKKASSKAARTNNLKTASGSKKSGTSTTSAIESSQADRTSAEDAIPSQDDTSKDANEPLRAPAKAVVHHPRKYVPAAHKRHPAPKPIHRRARPVGRRTSKPAAHHKSGVQVYDENGRPIRN